MRTRTRTILAGLVLAAALVGGVAWATIPDGNGLYTACKLNALGTIRLIDPSGPSTSLLSRCTSYETKITWNQKGPAGATGAQGGTGEAGAKGETGAAGTNGSNGAKGETGAAGTNGSNGTNGAAGAKGEPGTDGAPGAKGETGAAGANGSNGANGAEGAACLPTTAACVGPQGPAGPQGQAGAPSEVVEEDPAPYTGGFLLTIGTTTVSTTLAGCRAGFGSTAGEDCFFTITGYPQAIQTWLDASIVGNAFVRDLVVSELGGSNLVVSELQLDDAFLTRFSFDGFAGAALSAPMTVSFVASPESMQSTSLTGKTPPGVTLPQELHKFRLNITEVDPLGFAAIDPIVVEWPKVQTALGAAPGAPSFLPFRVEASAAAGRKSSVPGTTLQDLQSWSNDAADGYGEARKATLDLRLGDGTVVANITLNGLTPVTGLDPFPIDGRVGMELRPTGITGTK